MQLSFSDYRGSARQSYDAVLYGGDNSNMAQYLMQRVDSQSQMFGHTPEYYSQMRNMVMQYNDTFAQEELRRLASQHTIDTDTDIGVIHSYTDADQIRNATATMQTYIMANPVLRSAHMSQQIDGYSDTYQDQYPGFKTTQHPVWMRVNDGLTIINDEADCFEHTFYYSSLDDTNRGLTHFEKMSVLKTWDHAQSLLALGKQDPTDIYGGEL